MIRTVAAVVLLVGLASCILPVFDKEADADARNLYQEIGTAADLNQDPHLDPSIRTPENIAALAALRQQLPPGAPASVNNQGFNISVNNGLSNATLTHAYHYASGATVVAETVLRKTPGQTAWMIVGFHINMGGGAPQTPAVTVTRTPGSPT